jgi:hypothetical protein
LSLWADGIVEATAMEINGYVDRNQVGPGDMNLMLLADIHRMLKRAGY